jgi:dihydrofolate synthase/folylpolyglutamate synthase
MAFDYFVREKIDVAVVEVGLGGRLDSTNIITPEVSVITNIGWDHKDILGDTLLKIASEKAGIIKDTVPVVVSERQPEVADIFIAKAKEKQASLVFASDRYAALWEKQKMKIVKNGKHGSVRSIFLCRDSISKKIFGGVLAAIDVLKEKGFMITGNRSNEGLMNVIRNTQLKGRWQKLGDKPLVICDTGHNIDGIKEIVRQIQTIEFNRLHMVFGVVKDKDVGDVLSVLPEAGGLLFLSGKYPPGHGCINSCRKSYLLPGYVEKLFRM